MSAPPTGRQVRSRRSGYQYLSDETRAQHRGAKLPPPTLPPGGVARPRSLRGSLAVATDPHDASSRVLATAYPFLAATGELTTGPYVGENVLARAPFCFDPWTAYSAGIVRSHSVAIIGVKGSGKSMLAKSWACGLICMGRKVAVPHDPNGEWEKVADFVGGRTVAVGPGKPAKLNLLDPGPRESSLDDDSWRDDVLRFRRQMMKAMIRLLTGSDRLSSFENTALDIVLERVGSGPEVTVRSVWELLGQGVAGFGEDVSEACRTLWHVLRPLTDGELAGLFDGPSTVHFDMAAPMMVVNTSAMRGAAPEAQALLRLATSSWIRRATSSAHREPRVIVHEEAAIELLNDVAGGGLKDKISDEKIARHLGESNWYLIHRVSDLDALGDRGSATHAQALGLLSDCDTKISYAQHPADLDRSEQVLGWNQTMRRIVRHLEKGEGLWQIGPDMVVRVRNHHTARMRDVFSTDQAGGGRDAQTVQ